jgi:hypothetical protein
MMNENHRIELIRKSGKKAILSGIVTAQYVLEMDFAVTEKQVLVFLPTFSFFLFIAYL